MDLITQITPLIGIVARERTRDRPDLYDDARQEGLIRAWTVLQKRPDAPREYLVAAAKRGVGDVVRGRPAFGAEGHRGQPDVHDTAVSLTVRQQDGGEDVLVDPADLSAEEALRVQESAELRRVVRSAVASLEDPEDRLIVYGRFWQNRNFADIAEELDRPKFPLVYRWDRIIRIALRERLQNALAT